MRAAAKALARARRGVDWSRPCLIWIADFVLDATGIDHATGWRGRTWDEASALAELRRLAGGGRGECDVERAIDAFASNLGWEAAEGPRQGAVMVGVYRGLADNGSPAVFDGADRWIVALLGGGWKSLRADPDRMWEVPRA